MSTDGKRGSISDSLVLDDTEEGVVITGIKNDTLAAKSGLQAGDELVAATIQLDKLNKDQVQTILKALEPYEDNMKVVTKKNLSITDGLGSLDIDGNLGNRISGPSINGNIPNFGMNMPQADIGGTIPGPSAGLTGPGLTADVGGLKAPDVPELNTRSPTLNMEKPQIKGGHYKAPKFTMPHFNLPHVQAPKAKLDASGDLDLPSVGGNVEAPELKLSVPDCELKSPDMDLNGPKVDLNAPNLNAEGPNIKAPSGNIKWPHLNLKGPKVKGPGVEGAVDLPDADINLPKANIESPDLDVQTPDIELDKPSGKLHWPHTKWGKPKLHGPKVDGNLDANLNAPGVNLSAPELKGDLSAPDVDVSLPKADLTGPNLEVKSPNFDSSNGIHWPHLKWKKAKLNHSKADLDVNADLKAPDVDLSTPKINGPSAELNVPKANLECPDLDVQTPKISPEAPSGKIAWPHQKWKKPKVQIPKADLSADLSTPDVDLSVPKIDADVNPPDVDLNSPEAPSGKLKFPTLKKHTLRLNRPKVKTSDLDIGADVNAPDLSLSPKASLDGPEVDLNIPKADVDFEAPDANVRVPSLKGKWPTLKKPKWSLAAPKVSGPGVDADLSGPNIDVPDASLNLPKANVDLPKVEVNTPDVEGPSGLLKWFKSHKGGTIKVPKANVDADVKVPDVDLNAPDVDLSTKADGGIEAPKIKLPKMKGIKVKGPELDSDLKAPKASLDLPDVDLDVPDVDLKPSDLSLSAPKIDGSLDGIDLKGPNAEIQAPNLDASGGKLKLPKLKLPKIKGVDSELKSPDLSLEAKAPDAGLTAGDLNLRAPDVNLNPSGLPLNASSGLPELKLPSIDLNTPGMDLAKPDLQAPDLSLKEPNLNLSSPNINGKLSAADIEASLPKAGVEVPKMALTSDAELNRPDFNIGNSKLPYVNLPNLDLSSPGIDAIDPKVQAGSGISINTPSADTDLTVPAADLNISENGINGTKVGLNAPHAEGGIDKPKNSFFKFPKFKALGAKPKGPQVDVGAEQEYGSGVDSDLSSSEYEIPAFVFHKLPQTNFEGFGGLAESFELSKDEREEKEYIISKGVRLPVVNPSSKDGEKVSILDRLQKAKDKLSSVNPSPTDDKSSVGLKLDANASLGADSPLVRGDTFKVEKAESSIGLVAPEISTAEDTTFSQSLSNMLGLSN